MKLKSSADDCSQYILSCDSRIFRRYQQVLKIYSTLISEKFEIITDSADDATNFVRDSELELTTR